MQGNIVTHTPEPGGFNSKNSVLHPCALSLGSWMTRSDWSADLSGV